MDNNTITQNDSTSTVSDLPILPVPTIDTIFTTQYSDRSNAMFTNWIQQTRNFCNNKLPTSDRNID